MNLNKNTLASALPALGKLICRTSPLDFCKALKLEAADGTLKLTTSGVAENITYEVEFEGTDEFSCSVGFDEFRGVVRNGRAKASAFGHWARQRPFPKRVIFSKRLRTVPE